MAILYKVHQGYIVQVNMQSKQQVTMSPNRVGKKVFFFFLNYCHRSSDTVGSEEKIALNIQAGILIFEDLWLMCNIATRCTYRGLNKHTEILL